MDQRPKLETWNPETAVNKHRQYRGYFRYRKDFQNRTPLVQELKPTINKWNFMKLKCVCTAKEKLNWVKRKLTEWERIFVSRTSHRGLKCEIYEELYKVSTANGSF